MYSLYGITYLINEEAYDLMIQGYLIVTWEHDRSKPIEADELLKEPTMLVSIVVTGLAPVMLTYP